MFLLTKMHHAINPSANSAQVSTYIRQLILLLLTITAVVIVTSAANAALVSHWKGEGTAFDSAGMNTGKAAGVVNYAPGVVGQAFVFPDDGFISLPYNENLVSPSGFTLAGWIRIDGADAPPEGGPGSIYSQSDADQTKGFAFEQSGTDSIWLRVNTTSTPGGEILNSSGWSWGQFYHFAATFDATTHTMGIYRNGNQIAFRDDVPGTTMIPAFLNGSIGRSARTDARFEGAIDELQFYDFAMSARHVRSLFGVPEPATAALTIVGIGMITRWRRRSRGT